MNNQLCCSPLLAITPFVQTNIIQGDVGRTGLSGPNTQIIAFNSGTTEFDINFDYVVGLGVAEIFDVTNEFLLSQLGVVINRSGTLSNFEIAYTIDMDPTIIEGILHYSLRVIRAINNIGNDYLPPPNNNIFSGALVIPLSEVAQQISANKLIININLGEIPNVGPGDRIVLFFQFEVIIGFSFDSLTVSASVHYTTPS